MNKTIGKSPSNLIQISLIYLLVFVVSFFTIAPSADAAKIPADNQVLLNLNLKAQETHLPRKFDILVWNVHKGADGQAWARDLWSLSKSTHLVLLQEIMNDSFMPDIFKHLGAIDFWMAQSFLNTDGSSTGVGIASQVKAESITYRRSPDREPVLNTPKMALLEVFKLSSGKPLLVVNLHGINFVTNDKFENQINDLLPTIRDFKGAVIFAGDFNTWNRGRHEYLDAKTAQMNLKQIEFFIDPRKTVLDHIFVRDCVEISSTVHSEIKTSDHFPLKATLDCQ